MEQPNAEHKIGYYSQENEQSAQYANIDKICEHIAFERHFVKKRGWVLKMAIIAFTFQFRPVQTINCHHCALKAVFHIAEIGQPLEINWDVFELGEKS